MPNGVKQINALSKNLCVQNYGGLNNVLHFTQHHGRPHAWTTGGTCLPLDDVQTIDSIQLQHFGSHKKN